jgi:hypothetical protein
MLSEPEVVTVTEAAVAANAIGTGPVKVSETARKRATKRKKGCNGLGSRMASEGAEEFDIFIRDKGKISCVISRVI